MKIAGALLLLVFSAVGFGQETKSPEQALIDKGQQQIADGRFEVGRFTLQTLINAYPQSSLVPRAKAIINESLDKELSQEVGAFELYDRAQKHLKDGKFDAARLALQTLINLYPASSYAAQARLALEKAAQ